jgi:hypothetical protein
MLPAKKGRYVWPLGLDRTCADTMSQVRYALLPTSWQLASL